MKKLLITGAGGYIGSIASSLFLQNGYEVVGVDNFSAGFKQPLELLEKKFGTSSFRFYELDLRDDLDLLFRKEKEIDSVVHFAGVCSVDESFQNPFKYFSNNVTASENLLRAMKKNSVSKIIYSSSCSVYKDLPTERLRSEKDPRDPSTPYGESKLMVEKMIEWYHQLAGLQYVILRYFNVCGAQKDGKLGDSKKPSQLLVHNAIKGVLDLQPFALTFPKVGTPDGSPIRDYIDVLDLIDAHQKSLEYLDKTSNSDVFNIGTGIGHSVREVIQKVEQISGKKLPTQKSSLRQGDYPKRVASWKKAQKILDWKPIRSLEDSVYSSMLWFKQYPQGWV